MCIVYVGITIAAATYAKSDPNNPNTSAGWAVVGLFFLYYAFYNIAMSPLLASYTVEILPFAIQTKGLFVSFEYVNISLVFNQYVNPVALPKLGWKYYIVYTAWLGFEFVWLYYTIIETKGKDGPLPLEEIAALFDGPKARREITQANAEAGLATRREQDGQVDLKQDLVSAEKDHLEYR